MLTPGDLCCCLREETGGTAKLHIAVQESAEGIVPVGYGEGPNSVEWLSGVESYGG